MSFDVVRQMTNLLLTLRNGGGSLREALRLAPPAPAERLSSFVREKGSKVKSFLLAAELPIRCVGRRGRG
jgi:hypothetical protein